MGGSRAILVDIAFEAEPAGVDDVNELPTDNFLEAGSLKGRPRPRARERNPCLGVVRERSFEEGPVHSGLLHQLLASSLGRRRRALPKPVEKSVPLGAAEGAGVVEEHAFVDKAGAGPDRVAKDTAHASFGLCTVLLGAELLLDQIWQDNGGAADARLSPKVLAGPWWARPR